MKVSDYPNINMRLKPSTHKKLKLASALLDLSMMELLDNVINNYLKEINYQELLDKRLTTIKD